MDRVYIKTYGCQMNERDSEAVAAMLMNRGYTLVEEEGDADIVLINTCSVRDIAEQKAISKAGTLLHKRKKGEGDLIVGIMGCMAQNRGEGLLDSLPDLDLIVGTQRFHRVPDHLDNIIKRQRALGPRPTNLVDIELEEGSEETIRDHTGLKKQASAFVSIMQGCNMNCSYCIVPKTRGRERSRSMESIVEEVEKLAERGVKEVTLLGQIVTSYGRHQIAFKGGKSPFVQLLEKVAEVKGVERIRFTSPHPRGFKEDLVEAYRGIEKVCKHAHLPLQSGSDRVLKGMNRPYSYEQYKRIIDGLRGAVPEMDFSTDIIVGYPGEGEEDFEATKRALEEVRYEMAYIFKYSVRSGTAAEGLGDPVLMEVKEGRNQELLAIVERTSLECHERLVGSRQRVLVEGRARRGEDQYFGRTHGYCKVVFRAQERLIGEVVEVDIKSASVTAVYGDMVVQGG